MQDEKVNVGGMGLMNEDQARRFLGGLCKKTMYNLRKQGGLKWIRCGSRVMYYVKDLVEWIESKRCVHAFHGLAA